MSAPPLARTARSTPARSALLRLEVGRLRRRETRRRFDTSVHVGRLGADSAGFVARAMDLPLLDEALRVDVVTALVGSTPPEWTTAWIVRAGLTEAADQDAQWLASISRGFGICGRELDGCFVLTRQGWRDALTGEGRTWVRLRT